MLEDAGREFESVGKAFAVAFLASYSLTSSFALDIWVAVFHSSYSGP